MSEKRETGDGSFRELVKATGEAELAVEQADNPLVTDAVKKCIEKAMAFNKESDKILKKAGETRRRIQILMTDEKEPPRNGQLMTFVNEFTGEVLTTSGHNHKTLKKWKAEYGKERVMGWRQ